MKADSIIKSVNAVTRKWTKQRKAEERRASARTRRSYVWSAPPRVTLIDAAEQVMEEAYNKASSNGKYPALARQIMYAARGKILELVDDVQKLDSNYFTQTLLPGYMKRHPKTAAWDVAYDPRGHFHEPHTEKTVALGTLDVRKYLADVRSHAVGDVANFEFKNSDYPTCGPQHRFNAIVFIEKEGFMPLFQQVQLAERYDIGIMSTKGMSVTAARQMVDTLCRESDGVPLLVLRDFDKAGFSIVHTLQHSSERYRFRSRVQVIDLGLRLADAEAWNLESEEVYYHNSCPAQLLRRRGATDEEIEFLCPHRGRRGHRVELNAFTSEQLIEWIESKLHEHGITKVIPDGKTLEAAYRWATEIEYVNARLEKIAQAAAEEAEKVEIPKTLERIIRKRLKDDSATPWDRIVSEIAAKNCKKRASRRNGQAS